MTSCTTKLGSFVRARRLQLRLPQVSLAEKAGLIQTTISAIEVGTRKYLNDQQQRKLAQAIQCSQKRLCARMLIKPIARPHTEKGIFIRSRREALGMSLNVFARKMGPTLKWAQQLEVGRADSIRYSTLKPLAHALDLDISDLTRFVRSGRNETKSELGRLVRSRRKELGMSLEALGQKLHVSKQYVDYIETGQCPLSSGDEVIVRLASSLQLDASKLYAVRSQRKLMSPRRVRGLGGFLAARRVQLHLTQRELAKRACLNPSSICSIEVGIANPSLTTLYKLSTALGCKIPSVF